MTPPTASTCILLCYSIKSKICEKILNMAFSAKSVLSILLFSFVYTVLSIYFLLRERPSLGEFEQICIEEPSSFHPLPWKTYHRFYDFRARVEKWMILKEKDINVVTVSYTTFIVTTTLTALFLAL